MKSKRTLKSRPNETAAKPELAPEWVVNRQTTNRVCRVQRTTESPIGERFLGPFASRADATKTMCNNLDPNMEDPRKCWGTVPDDACRPPGNAAALRRSGAPARDLPVADPVDRLLPGAIELGADRLTFDGYKLRWHGSNPAEYTAFSGLADESARESAKDLGPTPQGLYAVEPANIEPMPPDAHPAWGTLRVPLEPYAATVHRMVDCFKVIRTGMYIHGGTTKGTIGCIEINDTQEHAAFFKKLKTYGKRIELEVRYVGAREKAYEDPGCPY